MHRIRPHTKVRQRLPRIKDRDYLDFIRSLPCVICGAKSEAAHVRYSSAEYGKTDTGAAKKPDDRWCVPLCSEHHTQSNDAQHQRGERVWWELHGVNPLELCLNLSAIRDSDTPDAVSVASMVIYNTRFTSAFRSVQSEEAND